jgi:hypothetical protein
MIDGTPAPIHDLIWLPVKVCGVIHTIGKLRSIRSMVKFRPLASMLEFTHSSSVAEHVRQSRSNCHFCRNFAVVHNTALCE